MKNIIVNILQRNILNIMFLNVKKYYSSYKYLFPQHILIISLLKLMRLKKNGAFQFQVKPDCVKSPDDFPVAENTASNEDSKISKSPGIRPYAEPRPGQLKRTQIITLPPEVCTEGG